MDEQTPHILSTFEEALNDLREQVFRSASMTQDTMAHAIKGLMERNNDLCNDVIANDEDIDQLEIDIDAEAHSIILKFSPVASDLRRVLASMKISSNLERIADQAVGIAKRAKKMNKHEEIPETRLIEPAYTLASSLLTQAISSFRDGDVDLAISLDEKDEELDSLHKNLIKQLTSRSENDPEKVGGYIHLIFITRFLERIGDHAVNIGEDVVFLTSAVDVRHGGSLPE